MCGALPPTLLKNAPSCSCSCIAISRHGYIDILEYLLGNIYILVSKWCQSHQNSVQGGAKDRQSDPQGVQRVCNGIQRVPQGIQ